MLGVLGLIWLVNTLLLFAVGCFTKNRCGFMRILLAGMLGAVAAGLSLLPNAACFHNHFTRVCVLLLMCVTAFGLYPKLLWQLGLFALLHYSVGGLTVQTTEPVRMALGALGICLACWLGREQKQLVPMELSYGENHLKVTALYDTGNTLMDPITGQGVLILDAPSTQKLTGLSLQQLNTPVESLDVLPGLRLIPYHTVGNSGFLLAMRLKNAKIQNRQESITVAFSGQCFGKDYQALTGGRI
jgi:stage II sporulation protein GA (sporulation sigma-E factor processing peptidase)